MSEGLASQNLGLSRLEEEPIDVLDLPQIHNRPSAKALLDTLQLLSVESRSWEATPPRTPGHLTPQVKSGTSTPKAAHKRRVKAEGVPQYLTKIVSSSLAWIEDDSERESIWDTASIRLSERSGRAARSAFTRAFVVPVRSSTRSEESSLLADHADVSDEAEISIHEPSLTGDDLGFKTWAASYVLARKWLTLLRELPALKRCIPQWDGRDFILELGAGTGLVGIAAAVSLSARVVLTDLPVITDNLARNVNDNMELIASRGGQTGVAVLDWSQPAEMIVREPSFVFELKRSGGALIIVAADPIYSTEHPRLLAQAIEHHLSKDREATVIIALPIRSAYAAERAQLRNALTKLGLRLVSDETEIGFDDWTDARGEEASEVECNITVWQRRPAPLG